MPKIALDAKTFILDGQRLWIHAAELTYHHHPRPDWPALLTDLRRHGFNTLSTTVPWNQHEPTEGNFTFADHLDLPHFLDLAAAASLHVILRLGPHIGHPHPGGGLPAWLALTPGLRTRTDDPAFLKPLAHWFSALLAPVALRTVTRGGPVLLLQVESEYDGASDESGHHYIQKIISTLRGYGLDIPILGANACPDSPATVSINNSTHPSQQILWPDLIVTAVTDAGWPPEPLRHLRQLQPLPPLIVSTFRIPENPDPGPLARSLCEHIATGAQLTLAGQPDFPHALPAETLRALRPLLLFPGQFADFLANSDETTDPSLRVAGQGVRLLTRARPGHGLLHFLTSSDGLPRCPLRLPGHPAPISVQFSPTGTAILPYALRLLPGLVIDHANISLLAFSPARRVLILHGPPGAQAELSINGQKISHILLHQHVHLHTLPEIPLTLLLADHDMATRLWILDNSEIILGPEHIGQRQNSTYPIRRTLACPRVHELTSDSTLQELPFEQNLPAERPLPPLAHWTRQDISATHLVPGPAWRTLPPDQPPPSHIALRQTNGLLWYAADHDASSAASDTTDTLLLPALSAHTTLWCNGVPCGHIDPLHPDTPPDPTLPLRLRQGRNRLLLLTSGPPFTPPDQPLGPLGGALLGTIPWPLSSWQWLPPQQIPDFLRPHLRLPGQPAPPTSPAATFRPDIPPGWQAILLIRLPLGQYAITLDGQPLPPLGPPHRHHAAHLLPPGSTAPLITIYSPALPAARLLAGLRLRLHHPTGHIRSWHWRPVQSPDESTTRSGTIHNPAAPIIPTPALLPPDPDPLLANGPTAPPPGAGLPVHSTTTFPDLRAPRTFHLHATGLRRGLLWLNGHLVARYDLPSGAPLDQPLPAAHLRPQNHLAILDHTGAIPHAPHLYFPPRPPGTDTAAFLEPF